MINDISIRKGTKLCVINKELAVIIAIKTNMKSQENNIPDSRTKLCHT